MDEKRQTIEKPQLQITLHGKLEILAMCDLSLNVVLFAEQPFVLWVLLLPAADVCSACRVAAL